LRRKCSRSWRKKKGKGWQLKRRPKKLPREELTDVCMFYMRSKVKYSYRDQFILRYLLPRPHRFPPLPHSQNSSIQVLLDLFQLILVLLWERVTLERVHFQR
jgi:hypothetical protein